MGLTVENVRELFDYDALTGALTWRISLNARGPVGAAAGCIRRGYRRVTVHGKRYGVHVLAWVHHYGVWPEQLLDHINRDPLDNRIANLRPVTHAENMQNTLAHSNNTSGFKGVSCGHKPTDKWVATIRIGGRKTFLGYFDTREEAAAAYWAAAAQHHRCAPRVAA